MNRRTDDVLAEGMVGLGLIIALVLALAGIWLIVQAIDLVVRQLATHPENKPLWIALGAWLLLTLLVIATHGRPAVLLPMGAEPADAAAGRPRRRALLRSASAGRRGSG